MHIYKYAQSHIIIILQQRVSVIPVTETCCWRVIICDCAYLLMCAYVDCRVNRKQIRYTPMYFCIQFAPAHSLGKLYIFGQTWVTDLVWHPPLHPVVIQMNLVHTHIYDIHPNSFSLLSTLLSLSCFFLSSCFQTKFWIVHLPIRATCRNQLFTDLLSLTLKTLN